MKALASGNEVARPRGFYSYAFFYWSFVKFDLKGVATHCCNTGMDCGIWDASVVGWLCEKHGTIFLLGCERLCALYKWFKMHL